MAKEEIDLENEELTSDKIDGQSEENTENLPEQEAQEEKIDFQKEFEELKEKYLRATADFENIKKRLEREKAQAIEYSNETFSRDLLPILDTLEAALKVEENQASNLVKQMKDGVLNTKDLLLKTLEKHGISHIKSDDEDFNPELHNAISLMEKEGSEKNKVIQTYQKGYLYKNRVLRPAMVVVSK